MTTTTNKKVSIAINTEGLPPDTNSVDLPTLDAQGKKFTALAAGFALTGHSVHRTDPSDGTGTYWAEHCELARNPPTFDKPRQFLDQIGGRP